MTYCESRCAICRGVIGASLHSLFGLAGEISGERERESKRGQKGERERKKETAMERALAETILVICH